MKRMMRAAVLAALAALPARAEDIVVTQFGAAWAGNAIGVAIEGGFFKKHGVPITGAISGAGGGTSMRNALASGLGYGEVVLSAAIAAMQETPDLRIVNVGARSTADILMVVKPDSPIRSIKDLEGKRIGISNPKSLTEIVAVMMVEKAGIAQEKVERRALGSLSGALVALDKGGVDVAAMLEIAWQSRPGNYRVILDVSKDLPPMVQSVGVATNELMRKRPELLRAILKARREAVDFIYANPKEAAKMLHKHFGRVELAAMEKMHERLAAIRYWSHGEIELAPMDNMVTGLVKVGVLKGRVDWSNYVDRSFLPPDLQK